MVRDHSLGRDTRHCRRHCRGGCRRRHAGGRSAASDKTLTLGDVGKSVIWTGRGSINLRRRLGSDALCARGQMAASHAGWTNRNVPWRESFCMLVLLSMLIAAPAWLMIRLLEPELV